MLVIGIGVQRNLVRNARANNELLRGHIQMALQPPYDSAATSAEAKTLRDSIRDLPRLRNEIRQLRGQKADLQRIQGENARLLAQLNTTNQITPRPPPTAEQGFVLNNTWAYAGFAAPEATVQTFFWAIRQQDLQTALACLTAEAAEQTGLLRSQQEEIFKHMADSFGGIQGYRISNAEQSSADKIKMDIQAAVNGQALTLSLRHIGQEWKIYRF